MQIEFNTKMQLIKPHADFAGFLLVGMLMVSLIWTEVLFYNLGNTAFTAGVLLLAGLLIEIAKTFSALLAKDRWTQGCYLAALGLYFLTLFVVGISLTASKGFLGVNHEQSIAKANAENEKHRRSSDEYKQLQSLIADKDRSIDNLNTLMQEQLQTNYKTEANKTSQKIDKLVKEKQLLINKLHSSGTVSEKSISASEIMFKDLATFFNVEKVSTIETAAHILISVLIELFAIVFLHYSNFSLKWENASKSKSVLDEIMDKLNSLSMKAETIISLVTQQDEFGCSIATSAMLFDIGYNEAKNRLSVFSNVDHSMDAENYINYLCDERLSFSIQPGANFSFIKNSMPGVVMAVFCQLKNEDKYNHLCVYQNGVFYCPINGAMTEEEALLTFDNIDSFIAIEPNHLLKVRELIKALPSRKRVENNKNLPNVELSLAGPLRKKSEVKTGSTSPNASSKTAKNTHAQGLSKPLSKRRYFALSQENPRGVSKIAKQWSPEENPKPLSKGLSEPLSKKGKNNTIKVTYESGVEVEIDRNKKSKKSNTVKVEVLKDDYQSIKKEIIKCARRNPDIQWSVNAIKNHFKIGHPKAKEAHEKLKKEGVI
ncbi:MAG: hypothetical protein V4501_08245 [Pseudomonadota bacterium]